MNIIEDIILKEIYNKNPANLNDPNIFVNSGQGLEGIKKESLFKIKEINELDKSTEILIAFYDYNYTAGDFWTAARTNISSLIFLEDRISLRIIEETTGWDKKENYEKDIYWHEIEEAKPILIEEKDINNEKVENYYVRIFFNSGHKYEDIGLIYFGWMVGENDCLFISELINNIIEKLNNEQNNDSNTYNQIIDDIRVKTGNSEFETVLDIIKTNFDLNTIVKTDLMLYHFLIYHNAFCLKNLGYNKEALKLLDERILISDDSDGFKDWCYNIYNLKAQLNEILENYYSSLQDYYYAFENVEEFEAKSIIKEKLNDTYSKFKEIFSELNYDQRKVILINDGVKPNHLNDFIVLDKSNLPDNLNFPLSHPKKEEIYIGHPYLKQVYLPFATYEASLFNDRFEEFSYFIQCLGAKSMTIKVIKGLETNISKNTLNNVDTSINFGKSAIKNNVDASYDNNVRANTQEDILTSRVRTQKYNPLKRPYIPENLLWYPHETSWHRLYQQRINGNILQHHDSISSKNTYSFSESEKSNLKIAYKNYLIDSRIDLNALVEQTFSQNESIEWEIEIEFESIENLKEMHIELESVKTHSNLSMDIKKEYLEEVKYMLEDDGIIDDKERRILERLRIKLGISPEEVLKIENEVLSTGNLTEDEKEYLEEFQEMLNDGEITDKERRILNRFANRLDISEERIIQLEGLQVRGVSN